MLNRKIISRLEEWKVNHAHEALLVKGARQVGKTTTIREFARKNYSNLVEINFEQDPTAKEAFSGRLDTQTVIARLSAMGYGPFVEHRTLVFLDEIQSCPKARTAIKFLVEDGRFDYIESGSLLGINYADVSSYPVGFESQIDMYPLDFEEWLWANNVGEDVIRIIRQTYAEHREVDRFMHDQLMRHYRNFLVVGGMPKVVTTFLQNPDFNETIRQQRIIIDNYRNDIAKYAGSEKARAKRFFDAIPAQLSKPHKRFVLSELEKSGNMQKYSDSAQWLQDAGVALFCYNTHSLSLPFEQYENRNMFKVYLLDTGLLCAMWNDKIQWQVMNGDLSINEGALTENFVAEELVKHGHTLHYYDRKSRNELDFIIKDGNKVSILEVKSGNNYKQHTALNNVLDQMSEYVERSIVLNKDNGGKEGDIYYPPLYMTMSI